MTSEQEINTGLTINTLAKCGTASAAELAGEIARGHLLHRGTWPPHLFGVEDESTGPPIADTTRPATLEEYAAWLRGYIRSGGSPDLFLAVPFAHFRMRYAETDVTVDSDREFGAKSRYIILGPGAQANQSNRGRIYNGWGHTKVYGMDGYRLVCGGLVPVFSDRKIQRLLKWKHKRAQSRELAGWGAK